MQLKRETYGAEFELTALLAQELELGLSYSYLKATYGEYETAKPGGAVGTVLLSGNTLPGAPEHKINLSATYRKELAGAGNVVLYGNATWQDDIFYSQFNNPLVAQDAYTIVNARASYYLPGDRWAISLFAKNLLDKHYFIMLLMNSMRPGMATMARLVIRALTGLN